jgi:uncharacterized coiled-coil protein SlyX
VVTAIGLYSKISSRFSELEKQIIENRGNNNLLASKLDDLNDRLQLSFNGAKEQVDHARNRFFAEFAKLETEYTKDIDRLSRELAETRNFLTKTTNFVQREYRDD